MEAANLLVVKKMTSKRYINQLHKGSSFLSADIMLQTKVYGVIYERKKTSQQLHEVPGRKLDENVEVYGGLSPCLANLKPLCGV